MSTILKVHSRHTGEMKPVVIERGLRNTAHDRVIAKAAECGWYLEYGYGGSNPMFSSELVFKSADLTRSIHLEFGVKGQITYCYISRPNRSDVRVGIGKLDAALHEMDTHRSAEPEVTDANDRVRSEINKLYLSGEMTQDEHAEAIRNLDVRPLPALNDNYNPPRPWSCVTHAAHECDSKVVGAIGAIPVCLEGAVAERAARRAEEERRARLFADPEFQARLRDGPGRRQRLDVSVSYIVNGSYIGGRAVASKWTAADIPDQAGRTAVVTGANTGIGFEIARALVRSGGQVVLACRSLDKAKEAVERLRATDRAARLAVVHLDLASLASVRAAARVIRTAYPSLDLLISNAGVMEVPYGLTEDGFEFTFGTNHLGHFALTGLLLDSLLAAPAARIVTMSSQGHTDGVMNFDDLQSEREYRPSDAYHQSKLANLLYTYELDRRLRAVGATTIALASYPGLVYTNLFHTRSRFDQAMISPRYRALNFWFTQSAQMGALPALRAATDPAARGGTYYGPRGHLHKGYPAVAESSARSHDVADQARLFEASEELTGVRYQFRQRSALP